MAKQKQPKKDVAKVPKGTKSSKKKPALSSWDKEYGDKIAAVQQRRNSTAAMAGGGGGTVWYDPESKMWRDDEAPAYVIKRGKNPTKRRGAKNAAKNKARRQTSNADGDSGVPWRPSSSTPKRP